MSEPTLIQDSSLPYKEKLVAGGYVELAHLPPSRYDPDWSLLLNGVLLPPELIKLKNALFPKIEGKRKHHLLSFIVLHLVGCRFLSIVILYSHMLIIMCRKYSSSI
jgi:hypothetical protein